jgi:hypothetical protein
MNKFYILTILMFMLCVFSAGAQDMIVLTNGSIIEAKVEEISPAEVKYRRYDNLSGPLIIINKSDVLSIKYENGSTEILNSVQTAAILQPPMLQASLPTGPALDPNKLYFSLSFEPSGFIAGGPSLTGEFSKGNVNTLFHASFPTLAVNSESNGFGMGLGAGINYFWNSKIGGFYLGGMFEWNAYPYVNYYYHPYYTYNYYSDSYTGGYVPEDVTAHNFIFALNTGYKFITKSGMYFRTGISAGVAVSTYLPAAFYYKPDIATGYIFNTRSTANASSNINSIAGSNTAQGLNTPVRSDPPSAFIDVGWSRATDSESDAYITINREVIEGVEKDVMTIVSELGNLNTGWSGIALDKPDINEILKGSNGVRFKIMGDGKRWRFLVKTTDTMSDGSFHGIEILTRRGRIVEVDVPYSKLVQPDWGKRVRFNKNNITGIGFERYPYLGTGTSTIKIFDFEVY